MIKDNQKNFNRLCVLIDGAVIIISYLSAWFLRFVAPIWESTVLTLSFRQYMLALVFIVPGFLILYQAFNLYAPKRIQGRRLELANIIKSNTLGVLLIMFALYMLKENNFSRGLIYIFVFINISADWIVRLIIRYVLRDMRKRGLNQKQILLVGYSRAAEEFIDRVLANPQWGYVIRGILDDNIPSGTEYKGIKVIGRIANLMIILPANRLDEIAITLGLSEY